MAFSTHDPPMKLTAYRLAASSLCGFLLSCGPVSRGHFEELQARQVTFQDRCALQGFFDDRRASHAGPLLRSEHEIANQTDSTEQDEQGRHVPIILGEGTYLLADSSARRRFRELVTAEYDRVPPEILANEGDSIRVSLSWGQAGFARRLRPGSTVEVRTERGLMSLPYSHCMEEFLFGQRLYLFRRYVLDVASAQERGLPHPEMPPELRDDSVTTLAVGDVIVLVDATDTSPRTASNDTGPSGSAIAQDASTMP